MKYRYNDYRLLETFQTITDPIKHYYSDFTDHDYPAIMTALYSSEKVNYLWIIRESGSFLLKKPDVNSFEENKSFISWYNAIKVNYPARIEYHISIESGYFEIIQKEIYG